MPTAYVASTTFQKWGGRVSYILEALGTDGLIDLLKSELGKMRGWDRSRHRVVFSAFAELSGIPGGGLLSSAGAFQARDRARRLPFLIANGHRWPARKRWYISYLDADTI